MDILLASKNHKKMAELQAILSYDLPAVFVHTLDEVGFWGEIEEDGNSFQANALIKARAARRAACVAGHPDWYALGDDSGLEVDALGGAPGIYSARYAGEHGDDATNNAKLLAELQNVPESCRTARFVCCIAFITPDEEETVVCGACEGTILTEYRGTGGFGYDPLFLCAGTGRSFSELSPEGKNAVSHRGRAIAALAEQLKKRGADSSL